MHAWHLRWREEGAQALGARAPPGRPSRLTPAAAKFFLKVKPGPWSPAPRLAALELGHRAYG
ncbi:helix-turn-helix domain-containing protein [Corallococcus sp. NCSPR001]|nr:helix-turn-helix domain-containing protein [Corallococcus sp. NCSPR001]